MPHQRGRGVIVAFRGERGSYNAMAQRVKRRSIVAFRGERGSYNNYEYSDGKINIVAFRGERGSYNLSSIFQFRYEPERVVNWVMNTAG